MPKCKNDPTRNYKGDEPSPKGLGYCAHAEDVGIQRKGKDKNFWEVKITKTGVKKWVKVPKLKDWLDMYSSPLTRKQQKILERDFKIDKLKKEMKSIGIYYYTETLKLQSNGYYITNYIGQKTEKKIGDDWKDKDFLILIVRINFQGEIVLLEDSKGDLDIQHHVSKEKFPQMIKIFNKVYGRKWNWSGKQKDEIFIKM